MKVIDRFQKILLINLIVFNSVYAHNLKQIINNNNLSNSSITDFCQNDKGLMLIGTCDGLNIYNNRDVKVYQPSDEQNFLSGNILDKIVYTGNNTFWIQTYYGLNKFDANTNTVEHYYDFNKSFFIEKDLNDNIFIIRESNSIYYYHKPSAAFKKILISGIIFSDIKNFFVDENNIIWILTDKGYSLTYRIETDINSGNVNIIPVNNELGFHDNLLYCFQENNFLLMIDDNYDFLSYNMSTSKTQYISNLKTEVESKGRISTIIKDNGSYFVGFLTNGLLQIEKDSSSEKYIKKELNINCGVFCLKKDKFQDLIWIGTDGKGVYIYSNTEYSIKSTILSSLTNKVERPVRALFLDKENTLWIGTKGDGILKIFNYDFYNTIKNSKIESLTSTNSKLDDDIIYAFSKSNKNILWIGGEEGLNFYSYKTGKVKKYDLYANGEKFKYIHSIYETNDSKLWITSVGLGVISADITGTEDNPQLENIEHYTINNGNFESNYFFSIYVENDSCIWFGNRGYGPFCFNQTTKNLDPINYYNISSNQTINDVFAIQKDSLGNLLIGTGYGLIKYNSPDKHKIFNSSTGFLNNSIHAIQSGGNNTFWLSTNHGIIEFNSTDETSRVFEKADGLEILEFSDGAFFKDEKSGVLFFGGINGFVSIQKDQSIEQNYMPDIYFDQLTIFGENYNIIDKLTKKNGTDQLNLKYKQNFFSLSFTAIDYINGGNYIYYYKIEGLSDQWINNGHSNLASFTNIFPGNYNLLVKYYNPTLNKESEVYSFKIKIHPPWYLTILAYCLYSLFFLFGIALLINYFHLKHKRQKQRMLDELEKKHQKSTFESKLRFFTNIAHEFCTPLTLISGPCDRILAQQNTDRSTLNYVQIIQRNAIILNNLIQELIEFRRIETENRELQIESIAITEFMSSISESFKDISDSKDIVFKTTFDDSIVWNSDRGFLTTILTNLLSNAFKYTPNKKNVYLIVEEEDENLIIRVINDGSAIKKENFKNIFNRYSILDNFENQNSKQQFSRNGLGLAISSNMVKLLKGTIDVENTPDKQVAFTVKLPLLSTPLNTIKSNHQNFIPTIGPSVVKQLPKYEFNKNKLTLLIIDDEIEILWFIGDLFYKEFNIITLQDSSQISKVLEDTYPSIIISDVMMPELDGLELTKMIKSNKDTAHIPIILVSSNFEVEQQIEALSLGAEMYITKPFNSEYLKVTVIQIIERKENLKDYFSSPLSSFELEGGKLTHKEHKKFIQSVLKIINDNITNKKLSTDFIADELGIGSRSLYRKIKEIGEQSPSVLIKECRLFIAKDLLIKTKLSIEEIGYKSGFSNKVTFFKSFHNKYNCTPKEFRMKNSIDDK